jgi:hypothetical protein
MGAIAANDLLVPPDHLALTFTWPRGEDTGCPSIVLPLAKLDEALTQVEAVLRFTAAQHRDVYHHARQRHIVTSALSHYKDQDDRLQGALTVVLWLALEHPSGGRKLCQIIAQAVQERGSARLSVAAHRDGWWAYAVAPGYVPMTELLDHVPASNTPIVVEPNDGKPRGPLQ